MHSDPITLNEKLSKMGYTHKRAENHNKTGKHDILDKDEKILFTGTASQVWEWLKGLEIKKKQE